MHGDTDAGMCLQGRVVRVNWKWWMAKDTGYVSMAKRLKTDKPARLLFKRALPLRRWETVRWQISSHCEEVLRIRADQLNGQHQEVVRSVSKAGQPFHMQLLTRVILPSDWGFPGEWTGCWYWSVCCALSLTRDLRGCLWVMISHHDITVTAGV